MELERDDFNELNELDDDFAGDATEL